MFGFYVGARDMNFLFSRITCLQSKNSPIETSTYNIFFLVASFFLFSFPLFLSLFYFFNVLWHNFLLKVNFESTSVSVFLSHFFFNESNFNELHWITNNRKCKVCWLIAQQQSTGPKTYKSQILIRSTARTNQQTKINVNILSTNH